MNGPSAPTPVRGCGCNCSTDSAPIYANAIGPPTWCQSSVFAYIFRARPFVFIDVIEN